MGFHLCQRLNLGGLTAVLMWALITAISTIICSIAQLPLANTTPIPTQELVWGTLRGACNRRKEKKHITAYWWNNSDEEKKAEHFLRFVRNFSYEHKSMTSSSPEFSSSSTPYFSEYFYADLEVYKLSASLSALLLYCEIHLTCFS